MDLWINSSNLFPLHTFDPQIVDFLYYGENIKSFLDDHPELNELPGEENKPPKECTSIHAKNKKSTESSSNKQPNEIISVSFLASVIEKWDSTEMQLCQQLVEKNPCPWHKTMMYDAVVEMHITERKQAAEGMPSYQWCLGSFPTT